MQPLLVTGLTIRLFGVALMIHSRSTDASSTELVWTQILQGMGGGFAAICSGVGAQAAVPHADLAMVIALVLLWTEIGGGVGGSVAGAIWSGMMPGKLRDYLPALSQDERDELFGNITAVRARPMDDPVRQGVVNGASPPHPSSLVFTPPPAFETDRCAPACATTAYSDTMKRMLIIATALSVIPLVLSLLMPNWYLGDQQNAVEDAGGGVARKDHDSRHTSLSRARARTSIATDEEREPLTDGAV